MKARLTIVSCLLAPSPRSMRQLHFLGAEPAKHAATSFPGHQAREACGNFISWAPSPRSMRQLHFLGAEPAKHAATSFPGRRAREAGGRIKPGAQAPGNLNKKANEPAERAAALSPAPRAQTFRIDFSWGLRPRLYSAVRFADYKEAFGPTVAVLTCGGLCEVVTWSFRPSSRRSLRSLRGYNLRSRTSEKLNDIPRATSQPRRRARSDREAAFQ
jgi:hypothetical protein